ncbi:MAG: DUF547 domain-containing protein, partial [Pseudobdellovibrionaceae bacterium]
YTFNHEHTMWDRILKRFVAELGPTSVVDYDTLKRNRRDFDLYVGSLETVTGSEFSGLSESEKLAFLINAYNALTIKLVLDNYPVASIKDIKIPLAFKNPTRSPWKHSFFRLFMEDSTLDDIEHGIVRKKFNEPRIHFALVCASKGCPSLRNEAYTADRLDQQLEDAATTFLKDKSRNRFESGEKTLYLSSIFKWYGSDFEKKGGSVKGFVSSRMATTPEEAKAIRDPKVKIKYLDYDLSLNDKPQKVGAK